MPLKFEYNPLSYAYPDDESPKDVFLLAPAAPDAPHPRAVLVYWVNASFSDGDQVWQVVRLDRHGDEPRDALKYVYPDMIVVDGPAERARGTAFALGTFTRDEREVLLECAEEIEYDAAQGNEGAWMSELLERMVGEGLVERERVDAVREAVPL